MEPWRKEFVTQTQETCTRNWYQSSGTRNLHLRWSIWYQFFWYQLLALDRTQLYSSTETVGHVTRTVQRDWLESGELFWCNCDELASKFFVQVSGASFLSISQE